MTCELSRNARRVQDVLAGLGVASRVLELPATTRTAADAAAALGCSIEQIAKSLVFRTVTGQEPVMVIASGPNRVNEAGIARLIGEPVEKADAAYVREKTGFSIGGVPPVGHSAPIRTIVDEDLLRLGDIWVAAGTPNSVVQLRAADLIPITGGTAAAIT